MKSDSNDFLVKSSGLWRKQGKGIESAKSVTPKASEGAKYRLGGYVRLSPSGEEREEGSLVSHPQRIKQFVALKNVQHDGQWGEIIEWYVDRELSGKDMNRPSFQRMCRDIANGKINAVIVTELSRLSRNVKDFCEFREFLKKHGAVFFSLKESFDTSTPAGELMVIQCISFAQFERQTIVERIHRGARARAERGLANGVPILGFDKVEGKRNHRQVNEQEKPYVEMIFRKFLELKSVNRLVTYLNENGYRTKEHVCENGKRRGGGNWTQGTLHKMLTNRAYIGQREINKHNRGVDPAKLKEEDCYFYVDAQWPAIIPLKLFNDVQDLLQENKKKARKYTHRFVLTGFIKCGKCGARLIGKSGTGRNGKYYYYGHLRKRTVTGTRHLERCVVENIPAIELEEAVIAHLRKLASDKALVAKLIAGSQQIGAESLAHKQELVNSKEQERRKLTLQIDNLVNTLAESPWDVSKKVLLEKLEEFTKTREKVEAELKSLREDLNKAKDNVIDLSSSFALLRAFREEFRTRPLGEQADVLRDIVRELVVLPDRFILDLYGAPADKYFTDTSSGAGGSLGSSGDLSSRSLVRTVSRLVGPGGIEPPTPRLEIWCSILLSYRPIIRKNLILSVDTVVNFIFLYFCSSALM